MRNWFTRCIIIAGLILASCAGEEQSIDTVTIVYSGNVGGMIDPCGCHPPLGGFQKRGTIISALRGQYDDVLVLDSGGLLYGANVITPPYNAIRRLEAWIALRSMDAVGTDAINVSGFDLANSADSLVAANKMVNMDWLSANLVWRDSGELVFDPDRSFTRGNLRIGVFGLMSGTFAGSPLFDGNNKLDVLDFTETATREVKKLSAENDIVIALAYMSDKEAQSLINEVPGINVLIHSHNRVHTPSSDHIMYAPFMVDNTVVVRCPEGGRVIGALELTLVGNDRSFVEWSPGQSFHPDSDGVRETILSQGSSYHNTFIDLGSEIRSDESVQEIYDTIKPLITAIDDSLYLSE